MSSQHISEPVIQSVSRQPSFNGDTTSRIDSAPDVAHQLSNHDSTPTHMAEPPLSTNSIVAERASSASVLMAASSKNGPIAYRNSSEAHDLPDDLSPVSGTVNYVALSPFEKIKLESDRRTAHGHPVILPTEYGAHGPIYDVLAMFNNAVKKQLLVGYNTLEGLQRYKYAVSRAETKMFFTWFDTLTDSIFALLAIEEDEIFPFLEANGVRLPEPVIQKQRMQCKDEMAASLQQVNKARDMMRLLPPGEAIPRITKVVPLFFHQLVEYYKTQGMFMPEAIKSAQIENSKGGQLRTKVMRAMKSSQNYGTYLVFASHWLRGSTLRAWKSEYLGPFSAFRYEQFARNFANNYQSIPGRLLQRLMSVTAAGDSIDGSSSNLSFYLNKKKNAYKV